MRDVVYMVREARNYLELALSLRSLANVPHGRVWVYGGRPEWLADNVIHVPVRQGKVKHENTAAITRAIAHNHALSSEFYWFHDDMYVLRPIPEIPRLNRGPWSEWAAQPAAAPKAQATERLMAAFGMRCTSSYELHIPMVIDRRAFAEIVEAVTIYHPRALVEVAKRSMYGNWVSYGGETTEDVKFRTTHDKIPAGATFVSTSDHSLRFGSGREVRRLFPRPSRYERFDAFGKIPQRRAA